MKAFLKSNAFRSVLILLAIALVSGLLLSVFNDLLYVSAEERLARTLTKIYGESVDATEQTINEEHRSNAYGEIELVYLLEDGNFLIKSTGKGGFKNGTVTLWTAFDCTQSPEGNVKWNGIGKVVYESSKNQTYISKTTGMYAAFTLHNNELIEGALFTTDKGGDDITNITAGASMSSAAINNAVNAAIVYLRNVYLGAESKYLYEDYIDVKNSTATVGEGKIDYSLTVKGNSPAKQFLINITVENGTITAYKIEKNGSEPPSFANKIPEEVKNGTAFLGKNETQIKALLTDKGALSQESGLLSSGATYSTESCVRAAAFAVCNYALVFSEGGLS